MIPLNGPVEGVNGPPKPERGPSSVKTNRVEREFLYDSMTTHEHPSSSEVISGTRPAEPSIGPSGSEGEPSWLVSESEFAEARLNRDLSWLEFNRRVLHEALDERTPLLERLKFLAIFSSNLDEFFMKRVESLRRRARNHWAGPGGDGHPASTLLASIRQTVTQMQAQQAACFDELVDQLRTHDVELLDRSDWSESEHHAVATLFVERIFPGLTPQALDPGHPFPFLSNLSCNLGVVLRQPGSEENLFARVKVPNILPQWIRLELDPDETAGPEGRHAFVRLLDVIHENLPRLFPEMTIVSVTPFRVSRNAEVAHDEGEEAENLRETITAVIRQRRFEPVVRLELGADPAPWVRNLLMRQFALNESDVYELPGELDYSGLFAVAALKLPAIRNRAWDPVVPAVLADPEVDLFAVLREHDLLVHHPYESFDASVEQFIRTAAADPHVVAIKMTVYRVGDDTPFVRSLVHAAENGKQVACLIELKARFDEARNLHWARELEKVGAHVVYGVIGLKTHSKTALVVRQEDDRLACYAHIGTGNYHVKTARLYTDIGLFTTDDEITRDLVDLFNYLTGRSRFNNYRKLLVAPMNMRDRFLEMIGGEIAASRRGDPARIVAKMNQLEDDRICRALAAASRAEVPIDLIVRGFCTLAPGIPGLTESIRISSVVGRFLEHARIFHFADGKEDPLEGAFYIGSADWMSRNLSYRVEAIVPIEDRRLKERLWELLQVNLRDHRCRWDLQHDGTYLQRQPLEEADSEDIPEVVGTHEYLMAKTVSRSREELNVLAQRLAASGSGEVDLLEL